MIRVAAEDAAQEKSLCQRLRINGWKLDQIVPTTAQEIGTYHDPGCLLYSGSKPAEICLQVRRNNPTLPVVLVDSEIDVGLLCSQFRSTVFAALQIPIDDHRLTSCLNMAIEFSVARQQSYHEHQEIEAAKQTLTPRELEVLDDLLHGLSTKVIAARRGIEPKTAAKHVTRVLGKMDVENQASLVRLFWMNDVNRLKGVFFA